MTKWIWEDSTWLRGQDWKPWILIFARQYENPRETRSFIVRGFEPYFYAPAAASSNPSQVVRVDAGPFIDAKGRAVKKCFTAIPTEVRDARNFFEWTDEADVLFDKRFVVDTDLIYAFEEDSSAPYGIRPCSVPHHILPRICYFDIEVRSPPEIVPKPDEPKWPIVSIQCMDSYTGEMVIFTYGVPQLVSDQVACDTEVGLLREFSNYVARTDFDCLTGWYSSGFDMPYVILRAAAIGGNVEGLSRVANQWNAPKASKREHGEWSSRIVGRQHIDMLDAFKKWYKAEGELASFDLKSVAKATIGFEYTDYGAHIDELFEERRWDEFLQYCRNDLIALRGIDEKIKLFDFYEGLRLLCGVKLEETLLNSKMIESILMRNHIKPMPTRRYDKTPTDSYRGALVLDPPIGVHDNVGVVDLAALYPTIIIAFDVSPDVDHTIPRVMAGLMEEREKLRALKLKGEADDSTKKKEVVLKFIINSFYGVLGWPSFRLYDPTCAEFITSTGRDINVYLQRTAKGLGYEPVYGDTDSIFIKGVASAEDGLRLQSEFNSALQEWAIQKDAKVAPTLKFEKLYRRIVFKKASSGKGAAKKRYAGHIIWKDGVANDKLDVTGIEIKRSDQSEITKLVMKNFLEELLLHDDVEAALAHVHEVANCVRRGEISVHAIAIPRGRRSTKDSPWKRGTENAEKVLGVRIPEGVKPRLLYTKRPVREICIYDDVSEEHVRERVEIDWKQMAIVAVEKKMKSFVESIGCNWNVVVNGQRTMDEWF